MADILASIIILLLIIPGLSIVAAECVSGVIETYCRFRDARASGNLPTFRRRK